MKLTVALSRVASSGMSTAVWEGGRCKDRCRFDPCSGSRLPLSTVSCTVLFEPLKLFSRLGPLKSPVLEGPGAAPLPSAVARSNRSMIRKACRARSIGVAMPSERPLDENLQRLQLLSPIPLLSQTLLPTEVCTGTAYLQSLRGAYTHALQVLTPFKRNTISDMQPNRLAECH